MQWNMSGILQAVDFAHAGEGAADVRDGEGAADDEGDVEGVDDFVALPAFLAATHEMVGDAVVAGRTALATRPRSSLVLVPSGPGS